MLVKLNFDKLADKIIEEARISIPGAVYAKTRAPKGPESAYYKAKGRIGSEGEVDFLETDNAPAVMLTLEMVKASAELLPDVPFNTLAPKPVLFS